MEAIRGVIELINGFVWGPPMLALLLGVGFFLTVGLTFMPLRKLPYAIKQLFAGRKPHGDASDGDVTPFAALMTALSSTIGTGNIAGVAVAIAIGGPGALFWMWVTALVGMASKYTEAVLAVKFREVDADGRHVGGPMYYIHNGLSKKWHWLAGAFAIFGVLASWGTGASIQSNSVADVFNSTFDIPPLATGAVLAVITAMVILGGIKRIANVASALVPTMAIAYLLAGLVVLAINYAAIPDALVRIVTNAFGYDAALGGFVGGAFWMALRFGVARGIFSNEAGQGSAPIAHAAAQNNDPVNQGVIAMLGTFIDTIVVCSITGLVIITSGVLGPDCHAFVQLQGMPDAPSNCLTGAPLTASAFQDALPGVGNYIVTFGLAIFAFTTILGWSYYGERCAEYLFGEKIIMPFRISWVLVVFLGSAVLSLRGEGITNVVNLFWLFADSLTGLMAAPNLVALALLSPLVFKMTKEYFAREENQ